MLSASKRSGCNPSLHISKELPSPSCPPPPTATHSPLLMPKGSGRWAHRSDGHVACLPCPARLLQLTATPQMGSAHAKFIVNIYRVKLRLPVNCAGSKKKNKERNKNLYNQGPRLTAGCYSCCSAEANLAAPHLQQLPGATSHPLAFSRAAFLLFCFIFSPTPGHSIRSCSLHHFSSPTRTAPSCPAILQRLC